MATADQQRRACEHRPLGGCGTFLSGGTPNTAVREYWGGDIPWISAASLHNFRISRSERRITSLGASNGTRLVPAGTVLFVVRGMSLMSEFRVGITTREVGFGQDCKALLVTPEINAEYMAYALQSAAPKILGLVDQASHGTGRLATDALMGVEVFVPSLPEQREIAAILASVDETIERSQAVVEQLHVVKTGLMQELLTRGLPGQHTRFKMTEIGELPEAWQVLPVGAAGRVDTGKAKDPRSTGRPRPYLRVANVFDGEIHVDDILEMGFTDEEFARFELAMGDVLLNEGQSIDLVGRCAMYRGEAGRPCAIQNALLRFRPADGVAPEYAEQYFRWCQRSGRFAEIATRTTTIAHLGMRRFASMPMAVPPASEQKAIASILATTDDTNRVEMSYCYRLGQLRASLMSVLLTGELRVTPDEATA